VNPRTGRRGLVLGLAAAALYVSVVAIRPHGIQPEGLLFDGFAPPQPYRWVSPPPRFADSNQPPQGASVAVPMAAAGSESVSVATGDAQAFFIAAQGAFPARPEQRSVSVTITPEDPAEFGPAPDGLVVDGNAYSFEARYQPSGEDAPPEKPVSIVLRYPVHATELLRRSRGAWTRLETIRVPASLEVFADTSELGTFAAAAPASSSPPRWVLYFSIGAIALAAVAGLVVRSRIRRGQRR
jgi:hypothetical protein